jgi:hypothetical protein
MAFIFRAVDICERLAAWLQKMVTGGLNAPVDPNIGASMEQQVSLLFAMESYSSNIVHLGYITVTHGDFPVEREILMKAWQKLRYERR